MMRATNFYSSAIVRLESLREDGESESVKKPK